jgi:hypothetical protein
MVLPLEPVVLHVPAVAAHANVVGGELMVEGRVSLIDAVPAAVPVLVTTIV